MATNLALDDKLIEAALKAGKHKTKKEAVTAALTEYVRLKGRLRMLELEGTIDFEPGWDHKAARRRDAKRSPAR
jgi:Arc/MetJ family transcription regulator